MQIKFSAQRALLYAWVMRTLRARYKQSFLGGLWSLLQPTVTTLIFSVVFTIFVPIDTDGIPYVLFSYAALVPWTFFTTALSDMVETLVNNMNLVSKIYFPREILPLAALLARFVDFGIASLLLVALMRYFDVTVALSPLVWLPLVIAIQAALMLGLGLAGAALYVFYRDVKHLLTLALQVWLYATPIIYPVSAVPGWLRPYYFLNPIAGIVEAYRDILLRQQEPGRYLLISLGLASVTLVLGYRFFKRVEWQFADVV